MKSVAVVGATADRSTFANKSVRAHLKSGWTVYPVHPSGEAVEGRACFKSLAELPGPVNRVTFYVRPAVGLTLLDAVAGIAPAELFLNPGTHTPELVASATARGLTVRLGCSIVAEGFSPGDFTSSPDPDAAR